MMTVNGEWKTNDPIHIKHIIMADEVRLQTSPWSLKRRGCEQLVEGTQAKNNQWLWWIRLPWNVCACFLAPWPCEAPITLLKWLASSVRCLRTASVPLQSSPAPSCHTALHHAHWRYFQRLDFWTRLIRFHLWIAWGGLASRAALTSARWNHCNGTGRDQLKPPQQVTLWLTKLKVLRYLFIYRLYHLVEWEECI